MFRIEFKPHTQNLTILTNYTVITSKYQRVRGQLIIYSINSVCHSEIISGKKLEKGSQGNINCTLKQTVSTNYEYRNKCMTQ